MTRVVPEEIQALLREASWLFHQGQMAEAVPAYRRVLAQWPGLPDSWFNLAMAERATRDFHGALRSYARAIELGIDLPEEVHLQRAVILADDLGAAAAARRELEAALAFDPRYAPALLNLGNHHEDVGDRQTARTIYARALDVTPDNALALARLIGVSDFAEAGDPLLVRARVAIEATRSAADRADLGFALGNALDRFGDYDAAFSAFAAANRASAPAAPRYDRQAEEALIDRLITTFPIRVPILPAAAEPPPLFICGMFRSGSTLAEHVLARHSRVVAGGELDVLPAMIAARLSPYPEAVATACADAPAALRDAYLAETSTRHPRGTMLTDKQPDNFLHIGLMKTLFPDARIVHTVRAARDNCLSVYFLHAGPQLAYATDLDDIAHHYRQQQRLMAHWRACYPDDIFDLDYDRLVAAPRPTIEALLAFCDLGWEEEVMSQDDTSQAIRTPSHWQVRQPLYRSSSGRWRNYRRHLDALTLI